MVPNQDLFKKDPDLYEEVLASEALDQYEGLLKHPKINGKSLPENTIEDSSHKTNFPS